MRPRWTYELTVCRKRTRRGYFDNFYALTRNDGKVVATVRGEGQAYLIKARFESWALQPGGGSMSLYKIIDGAIIEVSHIFTGDHLNNTRRIVWCVRLPRNSHTRKEVGFGYSPWDAYVDFVGKMGAY